LGCTVIEAVERVDAWEFREWQHYYSLEPWGPAGADARAVATTGVLARCLGAKRIRAEWILPWVNSSEAPSCQDEVSLRAQLSLRGVKFVDAPKPAPAEGS
jgi:hypothetical protein